MNHPGKIALFRFPFADSSSTKLRPVLILQKLPGKFDDFLVCMVSSRLQQLVEGFDDLISEDADDFASSGLKVASAIRIGRLAIVNQTIILGAIGSISPGRLSRIRNKLARWICAEDILSQVRIHESR